MDFSRQSRDGAKKEITQSSDALHSCWNGMACAKLSDSFQWPSADVLLAGEATAWCSEFGQCLHEGVCLKPAYM